MRSLVVYIFLYACESWSFTAELEKGRKEGRPCYNEAVRRQIQLATEEYDELVPLVKKWKPRFFLSLKE